MEDQYKRCILVGVRRSQVLTNVESFVKVEASIMNGMVKPR
jgi:hypothetical protein